jgi:NTE family protein
MLSGGGSLLMVLKMLLPLIFLGTGCAHYPFNPSLKQIDRQTGYRAKFRGVPGNSEALLFYLTFSGGGTRAAAFAYGVLKVTKGWF